MNRHHNALLNQRLADEHLPKLIVFDLDFTLWDCGGTWCDCLSPPFKLGEFLVDSQGRQIDLYPDVKAILEWCSKKQIPTALASRTERPDWARELLLRLAIAGRFDWQEIYPSSKIRHFESISKESGFAFEEMLFFDDEMRNIRELEAVGVACFCVQSGMSAAVFDEGLKLFALKHLESSR